MQGSGGAGPHGGKGGGAVWIHASNYFSLNGVIESKGSDSQTEDKASYGSGGGSGGSISIITANVSGTADSIISVAGGNGRQGGGGGAGGWIYGNITSFSNSSHNVRATERWNGKFVLTPGKTVELFSTEPMIVNNEHDGRIGHGE